MFETLTVFRIADALARHSGARQAEIARNIANSDTPNYRAMDVAPFSELFGEMDAANSRSVRLGPWVENFDRPRRIDSPDGKSPNGNTVNLEEQIFKSAETRYAFDLALGTYTSALSILRASFAVRG